jgi:hypothetical protein
MRTRAACLVEEMNDPIRAAFIARMVSSGPRMVSDSVHIATLAGDMNPELDYMPGGSLGTKPVYVTPLPAKDVLSAAAASKPAVEDEELANAETGWPQGAQVDQ